MDFQCLLVLVNVMVLISMAPTCLPSQLFFNDICKSQYKLTWELYGSFSITEPTSINKKIFLKHYKVKKPFCSNCCFPFDSKRTWA